MKITKDLYSAKNLNNKVESEVIGLTLRTFVNEVRLGRRCLQECRWKARRSVTQEVISGRRISNTEGTVPPQV